jgi:azurin
MKKYFFSMLALGALFITSCGGGDTPAATETTTDAVATEEAAAEAEELAVLEITIEANDQMKYNLDRINAKAGQTVKLTLDHVGEMAKEAMGHNWVLLAKGTDVAEFGGAAAAAADNDYIPADMADIIIAHTKTIGGGEETTIEFTAPEKGIYDFICSFPGHYGMMKGKFVVQ